MKHKLLILSLIIAGVFLFIGKSVTTAAPATFTVTNTNDSGAGSLRQAIADANGNGNAADMDVIEFNIPGSDVHTINLNSDLAVTQKVTINGYTQTGSSENTAASPNPINSVIKIEIAGTGGTFTQGALGVVANDSIVKGLSIYDAALPTSNFSKANVGLVGQNIQLSGNYFGVRADGTTIGEFGKNCVGIVVVGNSNIIGGTNPTDRNIINANCSINQTAGIATAGSGTQTYGNYVGLAKDGVTDLTPNTIGANALSAPYSNGINTIGAGGDIIGGNTSNKRNVFSGNASSQVNIASPNNTVQGNFIGSNYLGQASSTITNGIGVISVPGTNALVGGTAAGEGNLISGVSGAGVEISSMHITTIPTTLTPNKIAILGNSIKDVKPFELTGIGDTNLGIEISKFTDSDGNYVPDVFANRGPNANDDGDADTGPNGFINTPVLKTAQQVGNQLTINYDLDADDAEEPANQYRVEFFANDKSTIFGYGPGETYLGSATVTPGTNKTAVIVVSGDYSNKALSSTTTAVDTTTSSNFGSTSEFSKNISIGSATDFDADGSPDTIEDAAPNSGDGNNDGTLDRLQPTVTSFKDFDSTHYVTLATTGCSENGTVSSLDASSVGVKDNGYEYQHGLTDFSLNCSRGDTVNVTMYIHDSQTDISSLIPRKYNQNTKVFSNLAGATLTRETVGSSNAIKLAYSATDGGTNDEDGTANGVIVDPVGLASDAPGTLANTGIITALAVPVGFVLVAGGLYTYIDYRKHKKPLTKMDPKLAKQYTYWHHLKVVTIPLSKYRLRVLVEKKKEAPATRST